MAKAVRWRLQEKLKEIFQSLRENPDAKSVEQILLVFAPLLDRIDSGLGHLDARLSSTY